jgi:hypothetical protein
LSFHSRIVNELKTKITTLILLTILTVLVGIGVVYALSFVFTSNTIKTEASTHRVPTAEGGNDGLELIMKLEKTNYTLGEPVNVTLTIQNISNQTIDFGYSAMTFDFQIYNDTSHELYQWSSFRIFPQIIVNTPLDPRESLSRVLIWQQTCNRTISSEGVPVSLGTYSIIGQSGTLQTTPIQVSIIKP